MNTAILSSSTERNVLMATWLPQVRFQIPSELQTQAYMRWLAELFIEFFGYCHPTKNEGEQMRFGLPEEVGREGGIGNLYLGDIYFDYCKLYVYDGEGRRGPSDWKGVLLRDHPDKRSQVEPIYLVAELFEKFLNEKKIPHQRMGRRVESKEEELQQTEYRL